MMDQPLAPLADEPESPRVSTGSRPAARPSRPSLKILLVTWYFPPNNAVAGIRLGKMARYLEDAGHQIRVITLATPEPSSALLLAGGLTGLCVLRRGRTRKPARSSV